MTFEKVNNNIYRGSRPRLGEIGWLAQNGIKTILDLQSGWDELSTLRCLGSNIIPIEMNFSPIFPPSTLRLWTTRAILTDPKYFPIFVHCRSGVDRTGVVICDYRIAVDGWRPQVAIHEMHSMGMHWWLRWWGRELFSWRV